MGNNASRSATTKQQYNYQLPDHIASSREEIEREINNGLEDIEGSNEILRGIKFLSRRVKLSRRVSKKRRLRLGKLGQVVKQCEELQQEYETKYDNLKPSMVDNVGELESCTVAATDGVNADTLDDPKNLDSSDELGEDSNELKSITVDDSDELESSTVDDSDKLESSTVDDIDELEASTVDDSDELESSTVDDSDELELNQEYKELNQEYINKICDYLQEQLNVTFNMRDEDVRDKELGDVVFYYLMRGEEPNKHVQKIIRRLHYPLYDHTNSYDNYSWYEFCCRVLQYKETFTQFYKRLDNNKTALQYLLYKRPQLLLNKDSKFLMKRLIEHLPYDNLHQIITNIRDKNGQTYMFDIGWYIQYDKLYINHKDDLYKLLSIRNTTGQTALHVNTGAITHLLAAIYTPKQRDEFIKLTSITDNNNQTALQVSNDDNLHSLIRRVENNEYITSSCFYTTILIIYNTNNRQGAKEEAQTIYNACKSEHFNVTLEKNKSEDEIIDCITRSAKENRLGDLPTSLIVILMSHGSVGTIDDYHGNPIKLSDIEAAMCSNILDGKPKVLITQCCQDKEDTVIDDSAVAYQPTHDDFCAVMSCVAGERSTRGVFIGKLAEQIKNSKDDADIFKLVNTVSKEMEREKHKQTPIIMSTLTAKLNPTGDWRNEHKIYM